MSLAQLMTSPCVIGTQLVPPSTERKTPSSAVPARMSDSVRYAPGEMAISLTVTEFNLLHMLLRHPRQVLERRQILNDVWGYDFCGDDNVLEIYIGYLRKKLEAGGGPRLIQTVRGVGYVLREE